MKRLSSLLLVPLLAGCLSSAPQAPTYWTLDATRAGLPSASAVVSSRESVRLADVKVRAPFNGSRFAVLRPDGSVAFDAFNAFAAAPDALLRGVAHDVVTSSRRFAHVIPFDSSARAGLSLEVNVMTLALDCREAGRSNARVALALALIKGRDVACIVQGEAVAPIDGDYSAAFSTAFALALRQALDRLVLP